MGDLLFEDRTTLPRVPVQRTVSTLIPQACCTWQIAPPNPAAYNEIIYRTY